jgi:sulfite oxidase
MRLSRRRFLATSAAFASTSLLARDLFAQRADQPTGKELLVRSPDPFNAEPALSALITEPTTPTKHFYVRNHGPTPKVDVASFKLRVEGLVRRPAELTLAEIRSRFPQKSGAATLTCGGNRRQEMNAIKPTGGVQWDAGAIGTANWSGAILADVLKSAELEGGAKHVWFEGLDPIKEKDGSVAPFGGSIPLDKALAADNPVLLAHSMNGTALTAEHGLPLRTVVPGFIGARSVKWLTKITVSDRPSPNHYVAEAYKIVQSDDKAELAATEPIYAYPVNAAICSHAAGENLKAGRITISGYALPAGLPNCTISKVEISRDSGRTWTAASLQGDTRPYSWQLWTADLDLAAGKHDLVVRATDSRGNTMPERTAWNFKGYLYNGWHRVSVTVG